MKYEACKYSNALRVLASILLTQKPNVSVNNVLKTYEFSI